MKALITGIDGFVGHYLYRHLLENNDEVYGTTINKSYINKEVLVCHMDILDKNKVEDIIKTVKPECIYHLAGQSAVGLSWECPTMTMNINVNGTINLLDAVRKYSKNTKVLIIGSSDQYGAVNINECPIEETKLLKPNSPYGISKCTQEQIAQIYMKAYGMNIIMTRSFNHIGPGQSKGFVISDFINKIVEIEKGASPTLLVGNLEAYRDFTDVRDVVSSYRLLIKKGKTGEVYNVGSGETIQIRKILEWIIELSGENILVKLDENKMRPIDIPMIQCDNSKIKKDTGWEIQYSLKKSLEDILNFTRKIVLK